MEMLEWPLTIVPAISVAGRFALADRRHETRYRGATHALHLHDYRGSMMLAGAEHSLQPGAITLSPAGLTSSYDLESPGHHWCVHFVAGTGGDTVSLPLRLAEGTGFRERIAHVATLHARAGDDPVAATQAGLALQALLLGLATPPTGDPGLAERAAELIDTRFAETLDVATIADTVGCSQAHLARVFRRRYATTIPHRLIARRIEHARYLLESTDLPIWRIAERVGIPDAQYFNKTVRRLLGNSPSAIRAASHAVPIDPDR